MYKPLTILAAVTSLSVGCVEERRVPNPDFCTNANGDQTCAELYPDGDRPYCVISACLNDFHGCFPFEPTAECASPCGLSNEQSCEVGSSGSGSSGSDSSSGSSSEATGSETSSSTTGPMPCRDNTDCAQVEAPYCSGDGECVACDQATDAMEADAACEQADAGLPVCEAGTCVECTEAAAEACDGTMPVCDPDTNSCVACDEHSDCGEAACNLFTGACLPAEAVVHVGPGQRFTSLNAAIDSFDAGAEGTIVVHQANYDEAATVDGERVLAFLANADDVPLWVLNGGGSPQLTVSNGTVLMEGIQMSGNADDVGLLVDGGRTWVDRGRLIDNNGGGIVAQNSAELVLRNCFVGQAVSNVDALVVEGASADVLYSTLTGAFNSAALRCVTPIALDVRNSILVTEGGTPPDEVDCSMADITFSATEGSVAGDGNQGVGPFPSGMAETWFVGYGSGNYHLQNDGPSSFEGIAQWQVGDPIIDIDGDARPGTDGASDYAGADVP